MSGVHGEFFGGGEGPRTSFGTACLGEESGRVSREEPVWKTQS
jgi:hypothetical protein